MGVKFVARAGVVASNVLCKRSPVVLGQLLFYFDGSAAVEAVGQIVNESLSMVICSPALTLTG